MILSLVQISCLKTIRALQVNGHIPAESAIFATYARYVSLLHLYVCSIIASIDICNHISSLGIIPQLNRIIKGHTGAPHKADKASLLRHYLLHYVD